MTPSVGTQFQRGTLQRERTIHGPGWEKFAIFDWYRGLSVYGKRYETHPWLLWNVNRKSQVTDRSVMVPMTLSDLERRDTRLNLSGGSVWPRTTKCSRITYVGRIVFLGDQPRPYRKGWGPSAPQFRGSFIFMHTPFYVELPKLTWPWGGGLF